MSQIKNPDEYRQFTKPAELHKAINMLRGIVAGISSSGDVSTAEVSELANWCLIHANLRDRHPFSELIPIIEEAIKGSNASAATITAICDALGVGAEAAQYAGGVCERTKDELYEARIDDLQRAIARKERWNKRLFVVCVCLTAFILLLFAVDILNPNIGWFRT